MSQPKNFIRVLSKAPLDKKLLKTGFMLDPSRPILHGISNTSKTCVSKDAPIILESKTGTPVVITTYFTLIISVPYIDTFDNPIYDSFTFNPPPVTLICAVHPELTLPSLSQINLASYEITAEYSDGNIEISIYIDEEKLLSND